MSFVHQLCALWCQWLLCKLSMHTKAKLLDGNIWSFINVGLGLSTTRQFWIQHLIANNKFQFFNSSLALPKECPWSWSLISILLRRPCSCWHPRWNHGHVEAMPWKEYPLLILRRTAHWHSCPKSLVKELVHKARNQWSLQCPSLLSHQQGGLHLKTKIPCRSHASEP